MWTLRAITTDCKLHDHYTYDDIFTDVPRPLTNDLWVFLFQTIDSECVEWASPTGTYVYVKAFIVYVNNFLD